MRKNVVILLSLLLSGCQYINNSKSNSILNNSSSNDSTSNSTENISSSSSSSSINSNNEVKTLVIDPSNFNKIEEIELDNVIENPDGYSDVEFTFNALGSLKSNKIKGIEEIIIHVYQTYENLKVYSNYDGTGNALVATKELGQKEATYTYDLNGSDEFYVVNNSETHRTHVFSITIKYTGDLLSNNEDNTDGNEENTGNNDQEVTLKEGLKGGEWLEYYGNENGMACKSIPSTGTPDMLVVPVLFKDEPIDDSAQVLKDIEVTFNGTSSETSWESVDSFYQKSSYNKLDMDITVLDYWITLDKTCSELVNVDSNKYADPTWYALDYVVSYLKDQGMDMTQYDSNSDGFIDGVWMVYGKDYSSATTSQQDIMWAYTYWQYENTANKNSPVANVYAWASAEFMYEGKYSNPDAHTFIHETGHMLGLNDYYDYDENTTLSPAGCLDMMDYNIGDHNSYSKYLLEWVEPIYVTKETTLTLKPFESSGDCIIVPTSLSNDKTPMDEYLIIEYYTPTGLNESDATNNYQGKYPLLFSENGIKIYHVDSRIGKLSYSYNNTSYGDYVYNFTYDELINNTDYYNYYDIFASNTSSYSYNSNYKLLTLLSSNQNSKKDYFYSNTYASNKDLYQTGDSITSFTFNKGTSLLFKITIEEINSNSATISFS